MLRKLTIGKKVKVVMEYGRTVEGKGGAKDRQMDFGTVFSHRKNKNLSVALLEQGLLRTNISKSGDNASKFLEDLLAAEKVAADKKIGLHSTKQAPIKEFNDLVSNPKRAKEFEARVL